MDMEVVVTYFTHFPASARNENKARKTLGEPITDSDLNLGIQSRVLSIALKNVVVADMLHVY
jgi:hypothetical protein